MSKAHPSLAGLVLVVVLGLSGCGLFGTSIPQATPVEAAHIGVMLDAPAAWHVKQDASIGRAILFVEGKTDRDHAVIVQKLSSHKSWRDHADDFRDGQEHALDKIVKESEHEIGDGGTVFETRQQREGRPVVKKLRYYIEIGDDTYLLDMAAPEARFDPALYAAIAKTLRPVDGQ